MIFHGPPLTEKYQKYFCSQVLLTKMRNGKNQKKKEEKKIRLTLTNFYNYIGIETIKTVLSRILISWFYPS